MWYKPSGGWETCLPEADGCQQTSPQQNTLYHIKTRSIRDCIVSLCQELIRLIVRGKARYNVEFGAKISISVTGEGFTLLDRLSFDPCNELEDLKAQARVSRRRHGFYPKKTCADQIYRKRSNRAFYQRHGIRLSGPPLGRPKKDPEMVAAVKQQFIDDQKQRNGVEVKTGQGKCRCGLALILEKLPGVTGFIKCDEYPGHEPPEAAGASFIFFIFVWGLFDASLGLQRTDEEGLSYQLTGA